MLPTETCFVIGAGSGVDIDMPMGGELLGMIEKNAGFRVEHGTLANRDDPLVQAMFFEPDPNQPMYRRQSKIANEILNVNKVIQGATNLTSSIDDYVNLHYKNDTLVRAAKLHIAYAILKREGASKLRLNRPEDRVCDLKRVDKTWMFDFFKLLSKPALSTDPSRLFDNVSIINFNYDRCFEQFFVSATAVFYNIPIEQASTIISNACIIHPYGQVGDLPLSSSTGTGVPFGQVRNWMDISSAAEAIKTYTEQAKSEVETAIKNAVSQSKRVVFLGFGFHKQNIQLLSGSVEANGARAIYGTAFGESLSNVEQYSERLKYVGGNNKYNSVSPNAITLEIDCDCAELLQNHREVLSS